MLLTPPPCDGSSPDKGAGFRYMGSAATPVLDGNVCETNAFHHDGANSLPPTLTKFVIEFRYIEIRSLFDTNNEIR